MIAALIVYTLVLNFRLLKEYLGGNARTIILITLKSDASCADEALNALRFGSLAKSVVCRAEVNDDKLSVISRSTKFDPTKLLSSVQCDIWFVQCTRLKLRC